MRKKRTDITSSPGTSTNLPETKSEVAKIDISLDNLTHIGQYEIIEKIGSGAMGVVYKAKDTKIRRLVAIKFMTSGGMGKPLALKRFHRECKALAKLNHPNSVQLHSVGEVNKIPYMIMEYVEAGSLSDRIKENSLTLEEKLMIVKKLALVLQYAHNQKIIHRDIKPSNVILRSNGEPVLMDFGIAKTLEVDDHSLTQSGQVMGSPQYMSPEQAKGLKRKIDSVSDVYCLGALFYHLLLGFPPAQGETLMEILYEVIHKKPPIITSVDPNIPKSIEEICRRAMEKTKKNRYQKVDEIAKDIDLFFAEKTTLASSFYRQKKILWGIKIACIVIGLFLLGVLFLSGRKQISKFRTGLEISKYYKKGISLTKSNPKEAVECFHLALQSLEKKYPAKKDFEYVKWKNRLESGLRFALIREGKKILKTEPQQARIKFMAALDILEKKKNTPKILEKKADLQIVLIQSWFYEGKIYGEKGNFEMAYRYLSQAERLVDNFPKKGIHHFKIVLEKGKITMALLKTLFKMGDYEELLQKYDVLRKLHIKIPQRENLYIRWFLAVANFHQGKLDLREFQKLEKNQMLEIHIGSLYYQGRIFLLSRKYKKAREYFVQAYQLIQKHKNHHLSSKICLYYALSPLFSKYQVITEKEFQIIHSCLQKLSKQYEGDIVYNEACGRYYLKMIEEKRGSRELAYKAILHFNKCIEENGENATYYHLRSKAYGYLNDHEKQMKDLIHALDLDSTRLDIFIDKMRTFPLHQNFNFSRYLDYNDQTFLRNMTKALYVDRNINLFLQDLKKLRRHCWKNIHQRKIRFSKPIFLEAVSNLSSDSKILRNFAEKTLSSMSPVQDVLMALEKKKKVISETIYQKLQQILKEKQKEEQINLFLYEVSQVSLDYTIRNLKYFNTPDRISRLKKILLSSKILKREDFSILLRFLAGRILSQLPQPELRKFLKTHLFTENLETRILIAKILYEAKDYFGKYGNLKNYQGDSEFIQVFLMQAKSKICPNQSTLFRDLEKKSLRVRVMGAHHVNFRKMLKLLSKGYHSQIPELRAYSLYQFWNAAYSNPRMSKDQRQTSILQYEKYLNEAIEDPIPLIRLTALRTLCKSHAHKQITGRQKKISQKLRKIYYDTQDAQLRISCAIALAYLSDDQMLNAIGYSKNSSFPEHVGILLGLSSINVEDQKRKKWMLRRVQEFLNQKRHPATRGLLLYLLARHSDEFLQHMPQSIAILSFFMEQKLQELLSTSQNKFVKFYGLLGISYLKKSSNDSLKLLEKIYENEYDAPHIRGIALGSLVNLYYKQKHPGLKKLHEKIKNFSGKMGEIYRLGAIWGYYQVIPNKLMFIEKEYIKKKWASYRIAWHRQASIKDIVMKKRSIQKEWIDRMERCVDILEKVKDQKILFRILNILTGLYQTKKEYKKAARLLEKFCEKHKWKNKKIVELWAKVMSRIDPEKAIKKLEKFPMEPRIFSTYIRVYCAARKYSKIHAILKTFPPDITLRTLAQNDPLSMLALVEYYYYTNKRQMAFIVLKKVKDYIDDQKMQIQMIWRNVQTEINCSEYNDFYRWGCFLLQKRNAFRGSLPEFEAKLRRELNIQLALPEYKSRKFRKMEKLLARFLLYHKYKIRKRKPFPKKMRKIGEWSFRRILLKYYPAILFKNASLAKLYYSLSSKKPIWTKLKIGTREQWCLIIGISEKNQEVLYYQSNSDKLQKCIYYKFFQIWQNKTIVY